MLQRGDRLGNYEILGESARGTTSQLFPVRHVETHDSAALKLLDAEWCWLPDVVRRFDNERRILASLSHPNIIAVQASGMYDSGAPYVVLDWLPCALPDVLGVGPLELQVALRYSAQIGAALSVLHKQGLSHRELKPRDLRTTADAPSQAILKLCDLGHAKAAPDLESPSLMTTHCDLAYRAPEQFTEGEAVDGAADVYALGVLLFQMLAGTLPFAAVEPQDIRNQHLLESPPLMQLPLAVRAPTADLLDAMLAKRAAARPRIDEVCAQLARLREAP